MMIISRTSTSRVLGWFFLFMGVRSVAVEPLTQNTAVTTAHAKAKLILDLRITNRIYNDSLEDQESVEYKTLRQEVEQLFLDVYSLTPLEYLGTDQITFRNGSVIISAQLLFGTMMDNPALERNFFVSMYKQIPSPALEIDLDYDASLNSVNMFAVETTTQNMVLTTIQPKTKFYMEIRITNRIFNDTLEDQESEEYKALRQEVDELFFEVYRPTPLEYVRTDEITFRNGSVIVGAELLFGTIMINPVLERALFIARYQQLQSPKLAIDLNFVADELPTQQPVEDITTPTSASTTPSRTTPPMTTPLTSTSPNATSTPLNTTLHPDTNTTRSPNITATNSTTTAALNTTASIHNITSRIPTSSSITTASPSTAAAGVPGWGIALLVLAAICLVLLIILLIILLVMCCCWPNKKPAVKKAAASAPMYFIPEIPVYSTHSTIDSAGDKQTDVREKPPKNRTGMYVVNK